MDRTACPFEAALKAAAAHQGIHAAAGKALSDWKTAQEKETDTASDWNGQS